MTLKEKLQDDWKIAVKSRDKFKADTITMLKAAVLLVEKSDGKTLNDDQVIQVLSRELKQRNESIVEFEKCNRQDLVDNLKAEIQIIFNYLPQQLSQDELTAIITETINEVGAKNIKDMGKVMSALIPKTNGKADNRLTGKIVKDILNK